MRVIVGGHHKTGVGSVLRSAGRSVDATTVGTVGTSLVGQAMLVVSGVVVARVLGVYERGQLANFVAICVAASAIVSLGLPNALTLWLARRADVNQPEVAVVRRALNLQIPVLLLVVAVTVALAIPASRDQKLVLLVVGGVASVASLIVQYGLGGLQGLKRFRAFNLLRLTLVVPYALAVVVAALLGGAGFVTFAVLWTVGMVVAAVLVMGVFPLRNAAPPVDGSPLRPMVRYGAKAQIGVASPLESFNIDQIVIGAIAGPTVLGLYVVGYAFTNLPRFIAQSLGMIVFPRVAERAGSGEAGRTAVDSIMLTTLISLVVVGVLEALVGWLIPLVFGQAFAGSVPAARLLLVAAFFLSIRRVLADALRGFEQPLPGTVSEMASWVVFAVLVYPLTVNHGATGAAGAYAAASAAAAAVLVVASLIFAADRRRSARRADAAGRGASVSRRPR